MGSRNLKKLKKVEQIQPVQKENSFVQLVDYEEETKEELVNFLALLFKFFIGEGHEVSEWDSCNSNAAHSKHRTKRLGESDSSVGESLEDCIEKAPIIICLDNAQRMCPTSWQLLDQIT